MNKLWINAGSEVQNGKDIQQAKQALAKLAQETMQESGCFEFQILQDINSPQRFTLRECWRDADALSAHFEQAHTKAYLEQELTSVNYIEHLNLVSDDSNSPQ